MRYLKTVLRLFVAVAFVFTARSAAAYQIDFTGNGAGGSPVTLIYMGNNLGNNFYAGELNWAWLQAADCGGPGQPPGPCGTPSGYDPTFFSYCGDILNAIQDPEEVALSSTNFVTVAGVPDAGGKAAWLYNSYATLVDAQLNNANAEALQLAIWEALYDTAGDLSSGNLRESGASAGVVTQANAFLDALYNGDRTGIHGYQTSVATWLDVVNANQGQQLIGPSTNTTQAPVPEPGSLLVCASGLIALVRSIRLRRRAKAHAVAEGQ